MSGFARILEDLNQAEVRYVLIGGIALIRHGVVRATRDVDAVFDPSAENVDRVRSLIAHWGATRPDGSEVDLEVLAGDRSIHLSTPHGDLDLVAERVAGIQFDQLNARADVRRVDGIEAPICSLADLVTMKRAVGRERDLADLADLAAGHGDLPGDTE